MRIAVFGGTGATGRILVRKALEGGHHVVAYARDPSRLGVAHDHLDTIRGELCDAEAIAWAVRGGDAVISILGPKGRTRGLPIATGMSNIVRAMDLYGVRRLVATATPSYRDPSDTFDISFSLAVWMIRLFLPSAYRDIVAAAGIVATSDLDWTLVRIPLLSNTPSSAPLHTG